MDGARREIAVAGGTIVVVVDGPGEPREPQHSDADLLRALLLGSARTGTDARALAASIVDWREERRQPSRDLPSSDSLYLAAGAWPSRARSACSAAWKREDPLLE